jgi:alkaline phosphatase D
MTRRELLALTAAFSAVRAEDDVYPQGVASGDPHPDSVVLWTRRPEAKSLTVEVAEDETFSRVVSRADTPLSAGADWTCRIPVSRLQPATVYWYRFTDEQGLRSRIGRTVTAPSEKDPRPVRFAFASCQNVQMGPSLAYRRMIWEDRQAQPADRLAFVLHLGDFVYEVVWYPEDRPQGYYARKLRDLVRYPHGERHRDFHVPTTVDDYRALYRAYLIDRDLQNVRAYLPFVCMWDNHEFSWKGWQSQQDFGEGVVPAQTRKVAACQAWFEYQPSRAAERYTPPAVKDAALSSFDEGGLGLEPGSLAAIHSLELARSFRWGKNVELILTDNRSFRAQPVTDRAEFMPFRPKGFPQGAPADALEILDAGRMARGGRPPATIEFAGAAVPNPRKEAPPLSMLGSEQKAWFLGKLRESKATWKLWGNSVAMLDWRTDFANLPEGFPKWPSRGYALFTDDDWSGYRWERAAILEFIRQQRIAGFAVLAGDRHAFTAGQVSRSLPPERFDPVGIEFITGSISAPGLAEALEYGLSKDHPLRPLFLYEGRSAVNVALMHGVEAALALQKGGVEAAMRERSLEVAPHLSFLDVGGHGYTTVRAAPDRLEVEFVCIPRPIEDNRLEDGGPLAYRVTHRVKLWKPGEVPHIERIREQGALPLGST